MSNYLYYQHDQQALNNRFGEEEFLGEGYGINGLEDWRRLMSRLLYFLSGEREQSLEENQDIRERTIRELLEISGIDNFNFYDLARFIQEGRSTEELIVILLLVRLRKIYPPLPKDRCPRLFISHRQKDKMCALRIAELALQNRFAYWVDVLDPDLQSLANSKVYGKFIPIITACIIEMALINCTHVIACMTPNSRGTLWIPYEYGRITELPGFSFNACAWLHPNLDLKDFPEYQLLGELANNEIEIERWLNTEWSIWGKA